MAGSGSGRHGRGERKARRRRVQGAALSGGALVAGQLAGAMPAHAATFTVNSLLDNGDGGNTTLREAIAASNANNAVTDTINFDASLSGGTIFLTGGQLVITDDVTITGPGAAALTVDGQNLDRVFYIRDPGGQIAVTISGLTVAHGYGGSDIFNYNDNAGGIAALGENVTLDHMVVTANTGAEGGGVWVHRGVLTIADSTISENTSLLDGGGILATSSALVISGTNVLHNATAGEGGGLDVRNSVFSTASTSISSSLFDDNNATGSGGFGAGIAISGEGPVAITASTLTNNDAGYGGGGLSIQHGDNGGPDLLTVSDSTISGNTAVMRGGGIQFYAYGTANAALLVERSTISGNDGGEGGGVELVGRNSSPVVTHSVSIVDSTISGNHATSAVSPFAGGGGIAIDLNGYGGDVIGVAIRHSTVAGNSSITLGGGILHSIESEAVVTLDHTIVADNAASYGGVDLFGPFNVDWSLIGNVSGASPDPSGNADNVTGVSPLLSPLANNGGPTLTRMIAPNSPAHNRGNPAFVPPPAVDQRGRPRISGTRIDIGAVERQTSLPAVVNSSVNWRLRDRLSTGPANLPTFSFGSTPLVPVMGDWDGDGDKTPGYFKGGAFTLSNNLDGSGPFVTFSFGDDRGFPVAGDWDGNGKDEVAVFRNGTWQVRANTNPGVVAPTTFTLGSGTWPATEPVAGDWDGNGVDGVGFYKANGAAVGTWTLRQTATGVASDTNATYEPTNGGYGVVGDWDGDGYDTLGTKAGATWSLSNTHIGVAPVLDPLYVFDFTVSAPSDLPLVWRYGTGP